MKPRPRASCGRLRPWGASAGPASPFGTCAKWRGMARRRWGGRGRPAGHLGPPGRRREHSQFGGSGGRGDPLGGRGRRRGSPETGQRWWRRRRRPEQDMHVRGLQRDHEPGGQAAQTVDVQETPQQDVQGQVQEEEKRPGPELRWGRRGWQLRKRQTGGMAWGLGEWEVKKETQLLPQTAASAPAHRLPKGPGFRGWTCG